MILVAWKIPILAPTSFQGPTYEVNLASLISPTLPFASGQRPLEIAFQNLGDETLANLEIYWQVNDEQADVFNWTGNLVTGETDSLAIGTYNFLPGTSYDITLWISTPNGQEDMDHTNDTLKITGLFPALEGIYTVGGEAPDFATLSEVMNNLDSGGVTSPVTFDIRPGLYPTQLSFSRITGASCENMITFRSESGDSTDVVLSYTEEMEGGSPNSPFSGKRTALRAPDY